MTPQHRGQKALDGWTFVHLTIGGAMGFIGVPRPIPYALIVVTEVVESMLRPTSDFFEESRANILADLIAGIAAYEVGRLAR